MEQRYVFLLGGACVASGICIAGTSDGFGIADNEGGDITHPGTGEMKEGSEAYDQMGYDGIDNLNWDASAFLAILLFFGGVAILASVNRNIWKQTGGY